jgi:uncharacterized protein (UPF0548 family)
MENDPLGNLSDSAEAFSTKLRLGEGFDERQFEALCDALRACAELWATRDNIPKSAVILLVDLWPSIQACSYLYSGQEADRIMKAADSIADLTRAALSV